MNKHVAQKRILFVGGGTGGHFYPLIALAEYLNDTSFDGKLYYAGPHPYDRTVLEQNNIQFVSIPAGKQRRYASFLNVIDAWKLLYGIVVAVHKLFWIYPDIVVSKGGYTSVPVILAAAFLRIPIIAHESDAVPGRATKIAAHFATTMFVGYAEAQSMFNHPKVIRSGIPIRKELKAPPQESEFLKNCDQELPVLLILGGSQGAERVNELILKSLNEFLHDTTIIHQTGVGHYDICRATADNLITDPIQRARYHPIPTFDARTLNSAYHMASLIVTRAGSGTIFEIAIHQKPALIIPIPEDISHDQRTNAYTYARYGGAVVLEEQNLSDSLLRSEFERIMQNEATYASMVQGAASFTDTQAEEIICSEIRNIMTHHAT